MRGDVKAPKTCKGISKRLVKWVNFFKFGYFHQIDSFNRLATSLAKVAQAGSLVSHSPTMASALGSPFLRFPHAIDPAPASCFAPCPPRVTSPKHLFHLQDPGHCARAPPVPFKIILARVSSSSSKIRWRCTPPHRCACAARSPLPRGRRWPPRGSDSSPSTSSVGSLCWYARTTDLRIFYDSAFTSSLDYQ
jgi:hypothetical protein